MTNVLAYPVRVQPDGSIATVQDLSEASLAQEIALLVLTEPGERPLVPEYGLDSLADVDPISEMELNLKLGTFGVPAVVNSISRVVGQGDVVGVTVEFDTIESGSEMDTSTGGYAELPVQPHESVELS